MVLPHFRHSRRAWAVVALVAILANARNGSTESADLATPNSVDPWKQNRPLSIKVQDGRASFDIPRPRERSQTLVIVSALSQSRGPFPIQIQVRAVDKTKPIALAQDRPVRRPNLDLASQTPQTSPTTTGLPADHRTFHLLVHSGNVAQASNYQAVDGRLRAVGRRIQVYVDARDLDQVATSTMRDLVTTFDETIYPEAERRFGPSVDVDHDGRFTVLFSSWLTRLAGGKARVDGFVRGADLDMTLGPPFGNRCDMMYVNAQIKSGPYLRTIVAHEYTHAVSFSRKVLTKGGPGLEEEGWLDEAIAHLVEDSHGFSKANIDYRVSAFLSQPERYRLVVDDYYSADLFRSHGNRGATYLFLRWCVDRYGSGLVESLVRSELRGVENLENATGSSFAELFRRWTVSLYLSGLDPSTTSAEAYRSIDPRGEFEDWILAGPRASTVKVGGSIDAWVAEGTTAHYAIIEGSPSGALSIEVTGPPEAEIQVTAVPLPFGLARPTLRVSPIADSATGEARVQADFTEHDGTEVRLGGLAWEPLTPADDPRSSGFRRGGLDMLGIASAFGTSLLPAGGSLQSRAIPLVGVGATHGPIIFKAVGTDAQGRRVAAWSLVAPGSIGLENTRKAEQLRGRSARPAK